MNRGYYYATTFLVSAAVILLEISYTRIFSFKVFYYFTYFIVGMALLGGGAGGILLASSRRLQQASTRAVVAVSCLVGAGAVPLGYWLVARTQLNGSVLARVLGNPATFHSSGASGELGKLLLICVCLFLPFAAAGACLSKIFATRAGEISGLYFTDLAGAATACGVAVPLLTRLSPPGCVQLGAVLFFLAAAPAVVRSRTRRAALVAVCLWPAVHFGLGRSWPDPIVDRGKTLAQVDQLGSKVLFSRWDPVFRVDVLRSPVDANVLILSHDGMWGAIMLRFDGRKGPVRYLQKDVRSLPFRMLGSSPEVAIIGAAGGHEIVASLVFNARHVTAVELNPVTVSLLRRDFADFTGHLAENERVTLVNAEGRSFLGREGARYDLIWLVAPDSYAAMNAATSGAFVLSESYLYTEEMILSSLGRLKDRGVLCVQFGEIDFVRKPSRTTRFLSTARAALRAAGIEDFRRHVLVATTDAGGPVYSTVLLRKAPFDAADVARFAEATALIAGSKVRHPSQGDDRNHPTEKVIDLPSAALAAWYGEQPFDVSPVTDDVPYFWHFVRFRDVLRRQWNFNDPEEGTGERVLPVLVLATAALAGAFLLAPLVATRSRWGTSSQKLASAVFFAAIGCGFMFLEVSLIQRLTLFLGYPTHSLSVTLFALLTSTGLGSWLSRRYGPDRNAILLRLGVTLAVVLLLHAYGLPPLIRRAVAAPFGVRVLIAVIAIAPLGLCLGAFMPLGLRTVAGLGPYPQTYVAWAWAVNGFFSVVSSVLATMLSMAFGFRIVLLAAAAAYALAIAVLRSMPESVSASSV